jgi:hypothetical protein
MANALNKYVHMQQVARCAFAVPMDAAMQGLNLQRLRFATE